MDITGSEFKMFNTKTKEFCLAECGKSSKCKSVGYAKNHNEFSTCWLKTASRATGGISHHKNDSFFFEKMEKCSAKTPLT